MQRDPFLLWQPSGLLVFLFAVIHRVENRQKPREPSAPKNIHQGLAPDGLEQSLGSNDHGLPPSVRDAPLILIILLLISIKRSYSA